VAAGGTGACDPEIKSVLLGERTFPAFASRLEGCRGGRAFRERWDAFYASVWTPCAREIELFAPRWSECPDFVLDMVRATLKRSTQGTPAQSSARRHWRASALPLPAGALAG